MTGGPGMLFGWVCGAVTATAACAVVLLLMHQRHRLAERRYRTQARTDPLTGLPNRLGLYDAVDQVTEKQQVAVLLVDMDDFKLINDGLGHEAGDDVLVATGARLRQIVDHVLDGRGTPARIGGDEFVVLLPLGGVADDAAEMMARGAAVQVQRAIAQPVQVAATDAPIAVRASVGATSGLIEGLGGLLAGADAAMYRAKGLPSGAAYHPPLAADDSRPLVRHRDVRPDRASGRHRRVQRVSGVA